MKKITLLAGLFLSCLSSFGQAPSNDECENAIALTVNADQLCGVKTAGTTLNGTLSPQDTSNVSGTPNNDVWYTFVATTTNHRVSLSNIVPLEGGDSEDMGMAVYSGDCSSLVFEDTSDPNTLNLTGMVPGNTYYVRVYGWYEDSNPMSFDICIGSAPVFTPPVNDECDGAIALTVNADQLCGVKTAGTTAGGTPSAQDPDEVSGTPNNDVWYSFVATGTEHKISLSNIEDLNGDFESDMGIAVYSGGCNSLVFVDTSDPESFSLTDLVVGDTYYVRIYGWNEDSNPMNFDICIGSDPVFTTPVNDECEGAIALTVNADQLCGVVTAGTTGGGTPSAQDPGEVSGNPNNDVWYSFVATASQHKITLSNIEDLNGEFESDMGIAVYSGDCNSLVFVDTSDPESFTVSDLVAGDTYYVRVYGWDDDANPMSFDICIGTPVIFTPPVNDECEGAITLVAGGCVSPTTGTTGGGTPSAQDPGEVSGTPNNDVWYTFVATETDHAITIGNIQNLNAESNTDMGIAVYSGDCSSLSFVDTSDPETMYLTGLTVGNTYYVRVYGWQAEADPMSFQICVGAQSVVPDNDDCSGAIVATIPYDNSQDASGATNGSGSITVCSNEMNDGVWYTFIGNGSSVKITVDPFGWDPEIGVYQGDCGNLECVASIDDFASGGAETYLLEDSEVGVTYYVNVGYYGSGDEPEGVFRLRLADPSLAVPGFDSNNFKAYPNPVTNVLNLEYIQDISNVTVFNLLGQEMLSRDINARNGQLDMSGFAAGSYLVKVMSGNQVKTVKVIKQ